MIDFKDTLPIPDSFRGRSLDTLGQTGTSMENSNLKELSGLGSDAMNKPMQKGRAKRKLVTQTVVLSLIDLAKKKEDKELEHTFWNTYRCLNKVVLYNNRVYGKYCKNRICAVCNSIRKAEKINKYLPALQKMGQLYLVTLTTRSCYAKHLPRRVRKTLEAFQIIKERLKKRHQRGKGPKLMGIKSLECNFNPNTRTYNPHFHVIVPTWELAIALKREWMKLWTKRFVNGWAQDIQKIDNTTKALVEVVKYGSKIFTAPHPGDAAKRKVTPKVYISALYNILSAMKGLRLFDRFGFNANQNTQINQTTIASNYEEYKYTNKANDWINEASGEILSGYSPEPNLINILDNQIVKEFD